MTANMRQLLSPSVINVLGSAPWWICAFTCFKPISYRSFPLIFRQVRTSAESSESNPVLETKLFERDSWDSFDSEVPLVVLVRIQFTWQKSSEGTLSRPISEAS